MEENKKDFIEWVKAHKAQLVIAGVGVASLIVTVVGMKNKDAITELWAQFQNQLKKTPQALPEVLEEAEIAPITSIAQEASSCPPHRMFIRNLPEGWHHSMAKAMEAEALGISISYNQTIVGPYSAIAA